MRTTEEKRQETVRLFEQLDYSKNKELNDLVKLASDICEAPIALLTLMNGKKQWIKCKVGVDLEANSREHSFCKYLIDANEVLVVPDALHDDRFANNPAVTGDSTIRFYAGAPLITSDGEHLGSLCVFDQKPHTFTDKQKEMLTILSSQAMRLMELEMTLKLNTQYTEEIRSQKEKIDVSEHKLRAFFNSSASCHILIGKALQVLDFNKAAAGFIKTLHHKRIRVNTDMLKYLSKEYLNEFVACCKLAFAGKRTRKEVLINYPEKGELWWDITFKPVRDDDGKIVSVSYSATDINESKKQMAAIKEQNNSLLNIAYVQSHEYRRPVASILGLMNLIKEEDYHPDKEYLLMMEEAVKELDQKIKNVVGYSEIVCSKHRANANTA